ncbi:MAG: prolyl oligopeptidase family serine peptidase, partial [Tissierellaceae bacterium]
DFLIDEIVDKYDGDPNNISIMGHSMGGFTVAGIFAHNQRLKAAVALNGAFAWHHANEILKAQMEILMTEELRSVEGKLMGMDPMKHLASLIDRPILMLNGASDTVVSPESQKLFFKEIRPLYGDKGRIKLIEYPNLGHFVTTNMMEDSIRWLKEHLG